MKKRLLLSISALLLLFNACDPGRVYDNNVSIPYGKWYYTNKPKFLTEIKDTASTYTIYFNVRNTGDYKYSNLFALISIQAPNDTAQSNKYEFKLANPDGEWLGGTGVGDLFDNQIKILDSVKFPKRGVYEFGIEQNMRDNPLMHISDVGIRIEKN